MPRPEGTAVDPALRYVLRRSRRRTVGLRIDHNGLQVLAPAWVTMGQIDALVREKKDWIDRKLAQQAQRRARQQAANDCWRPGGTLPFLGRPMVLHFNAEGPEAGFQHTEDGSRRLWLPLDEEAPAAEVSEAVQRWMLHQAGLHLEERLRVFVGRSGAALRAWRLSDARTRWGSCNHRGDIRLSWRLMHLAPSIVDYVVAHEVAHLRHMHHGPAFWEEVERLYPGHHTARLALRRSDPAALPDFHARGLARFGL